jgi:hypothetical protein
MLKYCAGVNLSVLLFGPDMQESQPYVSVTYVYINGFGQTGVKVKCRWIYYHWTV